MIKRTDKMELRGNIGEAFAFVRFLVKNPKMFGKIKNGTVIRILPASSGKIPLFAGLKSGTQIFASETIFHSL
ncbi:MAG: hypothetical protein ABIG11_00630 [bacterium]